MTAFFDSFLNFDLTVFEWIQSIQNPALDVFFKYYTALGKEGILFIAISLALLISKKYRKVGFAMLAALAIMFVGNDLVLKGLFARPRPFNLDPVSYSWWFNGYVYPDIVSKPTSFSFPSGHASSAFAVAFAALFFNRKWGLIILPFSALMAFSRIYVEVHYPTDVIAGAIVGIVYALFAVLAVKLFYPLFERIVNALEAKFKKKKAGENE